MLVENITITQMSYWHQVLLVGNLIIRDYHTSHQVLLVDNLTIRGVTYLALSVVSEKSNLLQVCHI